MNNTESPVPEVVGVHRSDAAIGAFEWAAKEVPLYAAMIRPLLFAVAGALAAGFMVAAPAQTASVASSIDICAALRNGTSLVTIEATLEARGYSASRAGAITGSIIRQHCPDQAAKVMAQLQRQADEKP